MTKIKNMNTEDILEQFFHERNSSYNTQRTYHTVVRKFEKYTGQTLHQLLTIAEQEETQNITWKNSTIKPILLDFRHTLYQTYNQSTVSRYIGCIITIFRHYDITIPRLPYYSTKQVRKSEKIYSEDLPNKDILKTCIEVKTPLMKALVLFMSSSGISRVDVLNLTINDYLEATQEYHHTHNIYEAIPIMSQHDQDIIPCFQLRRQKTGEDYITFSSPESVKAINHYILSRPKNITGDSPLFKVNGRSMSRMFKTLNDQLHLGRVNHSSRFTPHMLRRYHATQLAEAKVSTDIINLLQGRKPQGIAYESYIRISKEHLREEYIKALPFLVVESINEIKTENQILKEENEMYKTRQDKLDSILERLEKLEQGD